MEIELTYHGWSSYHTWNVYYWVTYDAEIYNNFVNFLKGRQSTHKENPIPTNEIYHYISNEIFPSGITPDDVFLLFANWEEIAERANKEIENWKNDKKLLDQLFND